MNEFKYATDIYTVRPILNGTSFYETYSVIGYNNQGWAVIGSTGKSISLWARSDCMTLTTKNVYNVTSNLHEYEEYNDLNADFSFTHCLDLIPLVSHQVGPPHRYRRILLLVNISKFVYEKKINR